MSRTTRAQLEQLLTVAKSRIGQGAQEMYLDHCSYGWRLESSDTGRNLSPRLSAKDMRLWLSAFIDGLSFETFPVRVTYPAILGPVVKRFKTREEAEEWVRLVGHTKDASIEQVG